MFVRAQHDIHLNGLMYLWEKQEKGPCTFYKMQLESALQFYTPENGLCFQIRGGELKNEWQLHTSAEEQRMLAVGGNRCD